MAPLKVIGASFGRTGTHSLKNALNILGYNTFHMTELMARSIHDPEAWLESYNDPKKQMDWDTMYDGYDAAIDWPTCSVIPQLMEHYPEAKFVLTSRNPERWYDSMNNTIIRYLHNPPKEHAHPYWKRILKLTDAMIMEGDLNANKATPEEIIERFQEHERYIHSIVPPEKLLVYHVSEGWEPLCKFLEIPVPSIPFPHVNATEDFFPLLQSLHDGLRSPELVK
ncbi:hypothetical protein DFQ28_000779 [Apophysomyces sp. BC1034]|nr:hypothetical protein DFQ30_000153 [Apophysomyces sp. BC1015]KAG0181367.1 hypothetical protein DFQ29_008505 [Apophysomyces sp. BC1021]KAG0191176.1 hypothetical protein DFQ28_000779 [Apophysomyces sp. BC1034]